MQTPLHGFPKLKFGSISALQNNVALLMTIADNVQEVTEMTSHIKLEIFQIILIQ